MDGRHISSLLYLLMIVGLHCNQGDNYSDILELVIHSDNEIYSSIDEYVSTRRRLNPALNEATSFRSYGTLWPVVNGIVNVPYVKDQTAIDLGNAFTTPFTNAMNIFVANTNIRLVERTSQANYVRIKGTANGCYSDLLGLRTDVAEQVLNLQHNNVGTCQLVGIILHEFLHVLGIGHTQTREDRDDYVIINWDNIDPPSKQSQFQKRPIQESDDCGYYDYGSVMHYGKDSFGVNTISTIPAGIAIGQRAALSREDINCLSYLYNPGTKPVRIIPNRSPLNYIRHQGGWLNAASKMGKDLLYLQDSTFKMVAALSGTSGAFSFESTNYPNQYIRHTGYRLRIDPFSTDNVYKQDASFKISNALNTRIGFVSFESVNYPNHYIRLRSDNTVYIEQKPAWTAITEQYLDDSSFRLECTFIHKSQYVDTCPFDSYGAFTLQSSEEISCNRAPMTGRVAKGGTKRFLFKNDKVRDVIFTNCKSEFDPKLRLFKKNGVQNGVLVANNNPGGCDHDDCQLTYYPCGNSYTRETIQYTNLPVGEYYLQIEPYSNTASGGIYQVKTYCPESAISVNGEAGVGSYSGKPFIFAVKPDVSGNVIVSDCRTGFDPKLYLMNDDFEIISSDKCDYNGLVNDDCEVSPYDCTINCCREIFKVSLTANTNYFIGIESYSSSLQTGNIVIDVFSESNTRNVNGAQEYDYYSKANGANWNAAKSYCETVRGTELASWTFDNEYNNLVSAIGSNRAYIGLYDGGSEGDWGFTDGTKCPINNNYCISTAAGQPKWKPGEPNNYNDEDCSEMTGGLVDDIECDLSYWWMSGFVCNRPGTGSLAHPVISPEQHWKLYSKYGDDWHKYMDDLNDNYYNYYKKLLQQPTIYLIFIIIICSLLLIQSYIKNNNNSRKGKYQTVRMMSSDTDTDNEYDSESVLKQ